MIPFILVVIWTDVKGEQVKRSCQIFARWYLSYTVTVSNDGSADSNNLVVVDTLDPEIGRAHV